MVKWSTKARYVNGASWEFICWTGLTAGSISHCSTYEASVVEFHPDVLYHWRKYVASRIW